MLLRFFRSFFGLIWSVVATVFRPFWLIIKGTWHLLEQFAELFSWIADIPTKIKDKIPEVTPKVGEKITAAGEINRERKDRKKRTKVAAALGKEVSELILSEDYLRAERNAKIMKVLLIGLLQLISVFTTYRGLYQCFSQFGVYIPAGFTVVIQLSVFFFSCTIAQRHGHRFRGVLLVIFLFASLSMSYIGIVENLLPYSEYVEVQYEEFNKTFDEEQYALNSAQLEDSDVTSAEEAKTKVEIEWEHIEAIYNAASECYTKSGLGAKQESQNKLMHQTQTDVVDGGGRVTDFGILNYGDDTVTNPDTAAQQAALGMESDINTYQSNLLRVENLSKLLGLDTSDSADADAVTREKVDNAVGKQFDPDVKTKSADYRKLAAKIDTIREDCNALAEAMELSQEVNLDLHSLWESYCDNNVVSELSEMPSFDDVMDEWKTSTPIPEASGKLETFLNKYVISALPTDLKHIAETKVDDSYQDFRQTLYALGESTEILDEAYEEFRLVHPFVHAFSALGTSFGTAIIAVIIALFNDCSAVAIGLLISPTHPNWLTDKTFTQKELVPYNYIQFKSVMLTCIAKHFRETDKRPTKQSVYQKFSEIMLEFLDKFRVSGLLVAEGFGRYALAKDLNSPVETKLLSFMQYFDIARLIKATDAKNLGFDVNQNDGEIVMLKCRAELWLMDILGTASESQIFGDISGEVLECTERVLSAGQDAEESEQRSAALVGAGGGIEK